MPRNDDRFTGGDALVPGTLEHSVHLAMMSNELSGGHGAYRIGNARLGASGPSYGPFQYDLGSGNARARGLFTRIATSALDDHGQRIIDDADLGVIQQNLYRPFDDIGRDPRAQQAYDRCLPGMNAALASQAGRQLIDDDYVQGIGEKIASMNAVVAAVPDAANRAFLERDRLAQLMVIDTANQYGRSVNAGLHRFLGMGAESDPMPMPGRIRNPEQIGVNGDLGIEDLIRYKLETQYGQTDAGARDVLRRVSNLIDAAGLGNIPLSAEDKGFLQSGLAQYLADNGRNVDLSDRALAGLRRLGGQPVHSADFGAFMPTTQVAPNYQHDFDAIFSVVSRDGRWSAEQSNNIAGSLLRSYAADPLMSRIDRVLIGNPTREGTTNIFALHQPFGQAGPSFHARVDAGEAARTPLRESLQQLERDAALQQHQDLQQTQTHATAHRPQVPRPL